MKPINIYSLTRITDNTRLSRLERQMSQRKFLLKIKTWETDGLRAFCSGLLKVDPSAYDLKFYYSFVMPKLGKEFDLIRVSDEYVVNIELKSGNVSDEAIKKQLQQNRYYLDTLGRPVYFYTYVSNTGRLVRLSNGNMLVESTFKELSEVLSKQGECYEDHLEEFFREDKYLFSPLTDPDRFLRGDYFLTFQQKDIKHQILRNNLPVQGFTGYPGTGKTILLYDIAMQLSQKERVCVLHLGDKTEELRRLDSLLKRVDFYHPPIDFEAIKGKKYSAILVDEGHRLTKDVFDNIESLASFFDAPIIVSYNREDAICKEEQGGGGSNLIESIPGFKGYRLTNKIRLNNDLSAFIRCIMHAKDPYHRRDFSSVSLSFSSNEDETDKLLRIYAKSGYTFVNADPDLKAHTDEIESINVNEASSKEFDSVVMLMDRDFYYDSAEYLRARRAPDTRSKVRDLYHGLSRAKKNIAIIVEDNISVFDEILSILQR